jgi:hypothetical protein
MNKYDDALLLSQESTNIAIHLYHIHNKEKAVLAQHVIKHLLCVTNINYDIKILNKIINIIHKILIETSVKLQPDYYNKIILFEKHLNLTSSTSRSMN